MKFLSILLLVLQPVVAIVHPGPQVANVSELPDFHFLHLYNLSVRFFDNFVYPANLAQARTIESDLFSEHVLGRVDATRDIFGRQLNTEYTFGLWAGIALNPGSFTLLGIPESYEIVRFAASQNIVSLSAIVDFNITALNVVNPVELIFWATFNAKGQITQYDATFRWLDWQFQVLYDIGKHLFGVNSTDEVKNKTQPVLAQSICTTTQRYCNGTNQQYDSFDACFDHLTNGMPFGEAYQLGFDTILCRMVHQNMIPLRPEVHCPHVGPTGGGYCDNDRVYTDVVTEPLYKHQAFVPYGYQNANRTIAEA